MGFACVAIVAGISAPAASAAKAPRATKGATLAVAIKGLPPGVAADVRVLGPVRARIARSRVLVARPGTVRIYARAVAFEGRWWAPVPGEARAALRKGRRAGVLIRYERFPIAPDALPQVGFPFLAPRSWGIRPPAVDVAESSCSYFFDELTWESWTTASATASGVGIFPKLRRFPDSCGAALERAKPVSVRISLSRPHLCRRRLVFTRLDWRTADDRGGFTTGC